MTLEQALSLAYAQLNRREHTVDEVRRHLTGRGADPEVAETALLELLDQGYLDDVRFARLFVQDRRELSQWGAARIRRDLLERGVSSEVVEAALSAAGTPLGEADALGVPDSAGELQRALAVLERRFPAPLADRRERERALGVLLRKGYEYELAVDALAAHTRDTTAPTP